MGSERRAVLTVPHSADCNAIKNVNNGLWDTPWAFPTGRTEWRNKFGNRTPTRRGEAMWVEIKCNCTPCPALKLVRNDAVVSIGDDEL